MITIEELSAYNRKLVDMNLKLRKDNEFLASVIKQRNKQIDELSARNNELLEENGLLKERLERAKGIIKIFYDRDDSCWSIQKKAEEFLKECQ